MNCSTWQKSILLARERGIAALFVEAFRRYVFDVRYFYLYLHSHKRHEEESPHLRSEYDEFFVMDNETADLIARDREDFRRYQKGAANALDLGAVAFCVYEGKDLVHIGWMATLASSRRMLDRLGYHVRFERGEGWTGAAYTVPSWRGQGLLTYSCRRRFEYLSACGVVTSRAAVEVGNRASHRATMRFGPRVYAIGRQVKLLSFRWWSERPIGSRQH